MCVCAGKNALHLKKIILKNCKVILMAVCLLYLCFSHYLLTQLIHECNSSTNLCHTITDGTHSVHRSFNAHITVLSQQFLSFCVTGSLKSATRIVHFAHDRVIHAHDRLQNAPCCGYDGSEVNVIATCYITHQSHMIKMFTE